MRFGRTLVTLACVVALATGSALALEAQETQEPAKKDQPASKSKQEQAAAEKAAKEKAAKEKAEAAKAGTRPEQPKAAVNTLEDLFAAYGFNVWKAPGKQAGAAAEVPVETVVWRESPVARPAKPETSAKR